jgi:hypothetical protein
MIEKKINYYTYNNNGGYGLLHKVGDQWYLLKGSKFSVNPTNCFINKHGNHGTSRTLMPEREKILELYCTNNILQQDIPISSPSKAGALIGYDASGVKRKWKNDNGVSLSDVELRTTNNRKKKLHQ